MREQVARSSVEVAMSVVITYREKLVELVGV
jgi:hypothetical protein